MLFDNIPLSEITRHLNQVDLFNLILVNKKFKLLFWPCLEEIKKYISSRASILFIDIEAYKKEERVVTYHFYTDKKLNGRNPQIGSLIVDSKYGFYDFLDLILPNISINDWDLIIRKENTYRFISNKKECIVSNEWAHFYLNGTASKSIYQGFNGYEINVPLHKYSLYHWSEILEVVAFHDLSNIRFIYSKNELIYIEVNTGRFFFRMNCESINSSLLYNPTFKAKFNNNKCSLKWITKRELQ